MTESEQTPLESFEACVKQVTDRLKDACQRQYGRTDLEFEKFANMATDNNTEVDPQYPGIRVEDVLRSAPERKEYFTQATEIFELLYDPNNTEKPIRDLAEEDFVKTDAHGQVVPKFSLFSWQSFGNNTSSIEIIEHVLNSSLGAINTKAQLLYKLQG